LAKSCVAQAGGLEDGAGVELGAGLGRADRDALALQVGHGLDAGIGAGDDLDVVGVDRRHAAQLVERRLEAGFRIALPGVGQRVAEGQGDLAAAGLQQVEVLGAGLGRLHRDLGVGMALP
jgi:hypothetical protein